MKRFALALPACVAVILCGGLAIAWAADSGYHLLKTYNFAAAPGSTTEYFDYVTVDSAARRSR